MTVEQTLRWIAIGGVFALPFIVFIVAQTLFFPFITGKNFTFRIIVEIITGAWLALALTNPAYRPKRSWLLGAFSFFVVIVAIADTFGAYPFKSFWSNYERMDGWVTLAHLFCYFVVTASVLNTEKLWKAFWHTSLAVSALMGVYGLLQLAGIVSLNPGYSSVYRIDSTFGNPIYLAAYMLFHIGIAASLLARTRHADPRGARTLSWVYGGVIALDTLVLFLTGTRGTMLGLFVGSVLALILVACTVKEARKVVVSILVGIVVLGGVFFLVREQAWIQKVSFLHRLATISLDDGTTKARFMNWGMALEGFKERPILGWGQENYAIVFDKYYNPRMYGQEQWFDRVHNVVFDWLVAAGILGLLGYLSLFATALMLLWRSDGFITYERSILTGLLAAYFFHNLFVFDNISSYLLFGTVLAYVISRGSQHAPIVPFPTVPRNLLPVAAVMAVLLVWGAAWYVNAAALTANRVLIKALQPQQDGITKNLGYFKESISYGAYGMQEAREQLIQAAAQVIRIEGVPVTVKEDFLNTAAQEMSLQAIASPLDARFPLFLGALLTSAGEQGKAAPVLELAHELSPGKQSILFELAANRFARGDSAGALAAYKEAYELAPEFTEARLYYAALAIRMKEDALADELLAPITESGTAADPRIAAAYVSLNRFDKVAELWEARVAANPADVQAHLTLSAAYYEIGNSTKAIAALEKLSASVPTAKQQADALIVQIKSGTLKVQ